MKFLQFNKFYSPDDRSGSGGTAIENNEMSVNDMVDFMSEPDESETIEIPKPVKKQEEKTEEEEEVEVKEPEEEDELADIEAELEGPTDEQLELVTPVARREILKKYPQLFKDFPYLEKAYFREQQFTEMFPDMDDAKKALAKSETLDKFEVDLVGNGNTVNILKAVKENNPKAFNKIVDNYMVALNDVDRDAYFHVLGTQIKHTIISMVKEAKKSENKNLHTAAQILNQYVFGSSDFVPPQKLSRDSNPNEDERVKQIEEREREFINRQFNSSVSDLNSRVNNILMNTIAANIDPKNTMTDYVKNKAIDDAMEMLSGFLDRNSRFVALKDKLWERAYQEGFTRESLDRIKTAHISQSKTLLASVIEKARKDALRGMGRKVVEDKEVDDNEPVRSKGQPRPTNNGKIRSAKDIPRGMSTLDFLNQD